MRQSTTSSWRHFDFWLLGAVALLVIFGITMIRSAVAGNIELADLNLVQRQLIFALIGFGIILAATAIDYHLWASLSRSLYIGAFALLMVLFIVGAAFYGSARWFDTGIILIQPSEIAKIVLILTLANFFSRNIERIGDPRTIVEQPGFHDGDHDLDSTAAEPEHCYRDDRHLVCDAVCKRAELEIPGCICHRGGCLTGSGFSLSSRLSAAPDYEFSLSRSERQLRRNL